LYAGMLGQSSTSTIARLSSNGVTGGPFAGGASGCRSPPTRGLRRQRLSGSRQGRVRTEPSRLEVRVRAGHRRGAARPALEWSDPDCVRREGKELAGSSATLRALRRDELKTAARPLVREAPTVRGDVPSLNLELRIERREICFRSIVGSRARAAKQPPLSAPSAGGTRVSRAATRPCHRGMHAPAAPRSCSRARAREKSLGSARRRRQENAYETPVR